MLVSDDYENYSESSALSHVIQFLRQERETIMYEASSTMSLDHDAAKIAIAKLLLIEEVIRMIETLLQN
jgi:hypothetical protein